MRKFTANRALQIRAVICAMAKMGLANVESSRRELVEQINDQPKQTKLFIGAMANQNLNQLQQNLGASYINSGRFSSGYQIDFKNELIRDALTISEQDYLSKYSTNPTNPLASFDLLLAQVK